MDSENYDYLRGCLDEHKLTCYKALLQYDIKGKLIGNLRCGEDWKCERRIQLEAERQAKGEQP